MRAASLAIVALVGFALWALLQAVAYFDQLKAALS